MRVVITGASGYLAYFVVRELSAQHELECWIRPNCDSRLNRFARLDSPCVSYRSVDLEDPTEVIQCLRKVDAIVHLAYAHQPGRYREGHGNDLEGWYRRNVAMHLNLVLAAHEKGVERFIFLSSRAVYGSGAPCFSERTPIFPDSHYGALKAASEMLLSAFANMRHCSIRSTGVYGCAEPIEASKWYELVRTLRNRRILESDRSGTEVHGVDLARLVGRLLVTEENWPPIVNASDIVVSHSMIADIVARQMGHAIDVRQRLDRFPGQLTCDWLQANGFVFGGQSLLEKTLERLVIASERGMPA